MSNSLIKNHLTFQIMLIGVCFFGCQEQHNGHQGNSEINNTPIPHPTYDMPYDQAVLSAVVETALEIYKAAPNELKKSAVRTARGELIKEKLKGVRDAHDWIGTIKSMSTNSDGKAILEIQLTNSNIIVKTWNNEFSDISDNTLISQNTKLYIDISNLNENELVNFSGKFISDERDFLKESSLSEAGSMHQPEFIFKFTEIKKAAPKLK